MTSGDSAAPPFDASLTVSAPAKINLILRVLDRRADGYHNLWSVMHTVELEDEVTLSVTPASNGIRLSCDRPGLSADQTNLVWKAASAVLEHSAVAAGLKLELRKRIPMGAGLGGGSSDAAATILGLNHLLNLRWSTEKMREIGQGIGSDVAFFLFAPAAIVSDRGETVRSIVVEGRRWIALVKPAFGVQTRWAYQELGATRTGVRPLSPGHLELDRRERINWIELIAAAENDFEPPVFAKHPRLQQIKSALLNHGARCALLSGSGATVFGLFDDEASARHAADQLAKDRQLTAFVVATCSGPMRVREARSPG